MKLNPASSMLPLSRPEFMNIHPYAPEEQVEGYTELIENLSSYLCTITGFKGCTLQPNSGAAGEYISIYKKSENTTPFWKSFCKIIHNFVTSKTVQPLSC